MNISLISLLALIFALGIGIKFNKNCGIISIGVAFIVGVYIVGMPAREVFSKGWPMTVFSLTIAIGLLFGVANNNGTTLTLAQKIVYFSKGNSKILPLVFFGGCALISATGAGAPMTGVLAAIGLSVAVQFNVPIVLMAIMVVTGVMAGGLSPLAINGIVANTLSAEQGIPNYGPIWVAFALTMLIDALVAYFILGGHKLKIIDGAKEIKYTKFNKEQSITFLTIIIVVILVIVFNLDLTLVAITASAILLLIGVADEREVIKSIPWNVILLIGGVSILINVVNNAKGIDYLAQILQKFMNNVSAGPIITIMGGLLGAVSSGTGVAMPTLIPTASALGSQIGDSTLTANLIISVIIGINSVVISPFSTVGALTLAAAPEGTNRDQLLKGLLISAVSMEILAALLSLVGFYKLFI